MRTIALLPLLSLALAGCSMLPGGGGERDARTTNAGRASTAPAPRIAAPLPAARSAAAAQCLSALGQSGVRFDPLPDRYREQGCATLGTVQMHALRGDSGDLGVSNIGPVTCPVGAAFAAWARFGVDRAARQILGSPLASIQTMGSYSCRNVAGSTRRSAHATAAAIDVGGFTLADGRRITVQAGWNGGTAAEREFLRTVQRSACRRFGTVLGPDYNAAHHDHLHVEGVVEGNSYCR
ncbi:extensin family protein [Aurantiacibacter luteus]|nr:extensin family protein [Aurantiacibacter luteus]